MCMWWGGGYHCIYAAVKIAVIADSVEHSPTSLCSESQSAISVVVQGQSWVDCSEGGGEGGGGTDIFILLGWQSLMTVRHSSAPPCLRDSNDMFVIVCVGSANGSVPVGVTFINYTLAVTPSFFWLV